MTTLRGKTDNSMLSEKLALRTQVLDIANIEPLRVLETCTGAGVLWGGLRQKYRVSTYTPCDHKPKLAGTIRMEMNQRNLSAFDMSKYNVVDVDPYGGPWEAWVNLSKRIKHRTVFFLTHGNVAMGELSKLLLRANGIPEDWPIIPDRKFSLYLGLRLLMKSAAWVNFELCLMGDSTWLRQYGIIVTPKETA